MKLYNIADKCNRSGPTRPGSEHVGYPRCRCALNLSAAFAEGTLSMLRAVRRPLNVGEAPVAMIARSSPIDWNICSRKLDVTGLCFMALISW
jgi:hypothetical protein